MNYEKKQMIAIGLGALGTFALLLNSLPKYDGRRGDLNILYRGSGYSFQDLRTVFVQTRGRERALHFDLQGNLVRAEEPHSVVSAYYNGYRTLDEVAKDFPDHNELKKMIEVAKKYK